MVASLLSPRPAPAPSRCLADRAVGCRSCSCCLPSSVFFLLLFISSVFLCLILLPCLPACSSCSLPSSLFVPPSVPSCRFLFPCRFLTPCFLLSLSFFLPSSSSSLPVLSPSVLSILHPLASCLLLSLVPSSFAVLSSLPFLPASSSLPDRSFALSRNNSSQTPPHRTRNALPNPLAP